MSAAQHKRLAALEKVTPAPPETWEVLHQIIRPDLSIAGYYLDTREGLVELAPDDPRIKDYEPVTEEVNGGYRVS